MALLRSEELAAALARLGVIVADLDRTERIIIDLKPGRLPVAYVRARSAAPGRDMDQLLADLLTTTTPTGRT